MMNFQFLNVISKGHSGAQCAPNLKNAARSLARVIFMFLGVMIAWLSLAHAERVSETQLAQQVEQAVFWYSQAKKIPKQEIQPEALMFLKDFLEFLNDQDQLDLRQDSTEARLEGLLKQYDALIQKSGSTAEERNLELQALSAVFSDLPTATNFLRKFQSVIEAHYIHKAVEEKARLRPHINFFELMKTIGRYSIYGLSVSSAYHFVTGEYRTVDFFSEPVYQRAVIIAIASGPYGFFEQLFTQTMDYLKVATQARYSRFKMKIKEKIKTQQCRFIARSSRD